MQRFASPTVHRAGAPASLACTVPAGLSDHPSVKGRRSRRAIPPIDAAEEEHRRVTETACPAWRLVQIAELVRRAEELHLRAMHLLPPAVRAEILEDAAARMPAAEIEQLTTAAAEGAEIAEQIRQLAQSLPDQDVEIAYEDVREAAAADLARGMIDAERVLVAARTLDVATGWPALAEALQVVDIRDSWVGWTPRRMLSAFRGSGRQLVSLALQLAEIPPETAYADCTPEQIARLANAIDELGRAWRP